MIYLIYLRHLKNGIILFPFFIYFIKNGAELFVIKIIYKETEQQVGAVKYVRYTDNDGDISIDNSKRELKHATIAVSCNPNNKEHPTTYTAILDRGSLKPRMEGSQVRNKTNNAPSSVEEDDPSLRPDLVISVQPQTLGNIPVSTVDWRSSNRGQFIPMHGLDFLIGASSILIQQTVELNDLTSRIDSENRYIVRIPNGEALYIASETSSSTQRCLCGTGRAFVMHLHDNTRQEAMVFERRLAAASCLFPCRLQEMRVITPPGDHVGRIQQLWTWMVPFYYVRNASDDIIFVIEGPSVMKKSALTLSEFKILTADGLREIGKICHGWDRDLVSFTTTVVFPDTAAQPKYKALLLASAFLMEYTYFERAKSDCWRCNCC